jgi:rubredoxin
MADGGRLNLAVHVKAEITCATADCSAEHGQQIFLDPETPLDQLGRSLEERSIEAVQAIGWTCVDDLWYCPECSKVRQVR